MKSTKNQPVKKRLKQKAANKTPLTATQLLENALAYSAEQDYKKAINGYKALIKIEDDRRWPVALAECYDLRARQLADKGLFVEALAGFNSAEQLTGVFPDVEIAALWWQKMTTSADCSASFGQSNRLKMTQFYHRHQANRQVSALLGPSVAVAVLLNDKAVIDIICEQSVLWQHSLIVRDVMDAWCIGDDEKAILTLKKLPFRSAFRDLAIILKALLAADAELNTAESLIEQLDKQSVFYDFAIKLLSIYRFNSRDQQALLANHSANQLLFTVKDWSSHDIKLWKKAQQYEEAKNRSRYKLALQLFNQAKGFLTPQQQQQQLAAIYMMSEFDFDDPRFIELDKSARCRVYALQQLQRQHIEIELEGWQLFIKYSRQRNGSAEDKEQTRQVIAATYLHMAEQAQKLSPRRAGHFLRHCVAELPNEAIYQQLFDGSKNYSLDNEVELLEQAMAAFPDNLSFLRLAMLGAIDREDFDKGIALAEQLLARDPLDRAAKTVLINELFNNCRYLLEAELAMTEELLGQVLSYGPSNEQLARYQILQLLLSWKKLDKLQVKHWISQATTTLKSTLAVRLGLLVHGDMIGFSNADATKLLGRLAKEVEVTDIQQLLSFAIYLNANDIVINSSSFKAFHTLIKKSLIESTESNSVLQCCEWLSQLALYDLLSLVTEQRLQNQTQQRKYLFEFYCDLFKGRGRSGHFGATLTLLLFY